jgi:glyoxylase-like metal-dependent hydrolase (beta-lactamase superfamily II)
MEGTAMKQEQEEAGEDVTEVGPGVLRLQLPVYFPGLGHVNCYVLLDDRGAAVVDPGLPDTATWAALGQRLKDAGLKLGDVHTVVVTHSHPDHFGTAGRLAHEAGAELVTHTAFHTWWSPAQQHDCADHADEEAAAPRNPWAEPPPWGGQHMRTEWREEMRRAAADFAAPRPSRRLVDGDVLRLAGREWRAVHTPGHTLDHLCLFDPEGGLLLTGDHVLPTITPHISGLAGGEDPLKAFFASLDRVAGLDGVTLALPAHGHPFRDVAGRVKAIEEHHVERLGRLLGFLDERAPATVMELSRQLFRESAWGPMAESETYAHLEHLRFDGRVERTERDDVPVYRRAAA